MKVLVAIPTYNNVAYGYPIKQTLNSLVSQVFGDFRVLVVYKPSENDETLKILKEFEDKLDIDIKIQKQGYIEEAMNIIFEYSEDYDITLVTDDDAIPSKTWIQEHINIHKKHEKIGIATGELGIGITKLFFKPIRRLIGYYKPMKPYYSKSYVHYLNDMGLLVPHEQGKEIDDGVRLSLRIGGVNMSYKSKLLNGFRLPGATTRGMHYEVVLAHHYRVMGLQPVEFKGAYVKHLERESLSRPKSPEALFISGIENHLLPYSLYYSHRAPINTRRLYIYWLVIDMYRRFRKTLLSCSYSIGLGLALRAIRNEVEPKRVQMKILKIRNEIKNKKENIKQICSDISRYIDIE